MEFHWSCWGKVLLRDGLMLVKCISLAGWKIKQTKGASHSLSHPHVLMQGLRTVHALTEAHHDSAQTYEAGYLLLQRPISSLP